MSDPVSIESAPAQPSQVGGATPVMLWATIAPISGSVAVVVLAPWVAPWLREMGPAAWVYFAIAFAILGAVALAPTYTTSIVAGWAFGFSRGFSAVVIGTVGGAVLCYWIAKCLAGPRVLAAFGRHPKWDVVRNALLVERPIKTLWIIFLLRLSPVLPFGSTNVLLATSGVKLSIYILGTVLGLAPRTGLVAFAAASAQQFDRSAGQNTWMLLIGIAATVICIVVMAIVGKRALDRAVISPAPPSPPP